MSKLTDFFASIFSKFAPPELAAPAPVEVVPATKVVKTVDGVKPAVAAKKPRKPRTPKAPVAK